MSIASFIFLPPQTINIDLAEILHAPESRVVFLNQSAVFTCETDGGVAGWRVNGTLLEATPPEIRSDIDISSANTAEGSTVEILTIPGKLEYNGTNIQCLTAGIDGSSAESKNATLKIQGMIATSIIYIMPNFIGN